MAEAPQFDAIRDESIPSNSAEVSSRMESIQWDTFDEFTCLGSLASLVPLVKNASCLPSLDVLGRITARLKNHRMNHLPSLCVYLALSVSDQTSAGSISGPELHDFYKHVFHSTLRENNMHNFFRQHATIIIVRRFYYRLDSFRMEIVGALTFSRPTHGVPTYLAYAAVSSGRHNLPSLSNPFVHSLPSNAFPVEDNLEGYRGRGLCTLLICVMEELVTKSQRHDNAASLCRVPYPECYLHYNSNNADSGDGWLKHVFFPLFGIDESSDDGIATVRVRYDILARSLNGCNIFKASHLDRKNSTTMYTKFGFEVADLVVTSAPMRLYNDNAWFSDYAPTLDAQFRALVPSQNVYALDDQEIEANFPRNEGDPIGANLDTIIEMAFLRKRYCVNQVFSDLDVDIDDDMSDDDCDDEGPPKKASRPAKKAPRKTPTTSKSKASKSSSDSLPDGDKKMPAVDRKGQKRSASNSPTFLEDWQGGSQKSTSESSSWAGTSDDNKAFKARQHKKTYCERRSNKPRLASVPEIRERVRAVVAPAWEGTSHNTFSDQDFIDYTCVQDPLRAIYVDIDSLEDPKGLKLVNVHVPSYVLPPDATLENVYYDRTVLDSYGAIVQCSWEWLQKQVVPLLRKVLEEQLFGIKIIEGIGLDHPDPSVGQRDIDTMASFLGKTSRIDGFLSPPVSHKVAELPDDEFVKSRQKKAQKLIDHPSKTRAFIKHVKSLNIKATPPPLPRLRYQISRLKWIPTEEVGATLERKKEVGYWQGAYCVPGTTHYSLVSLRDAWVRWFLIPILCSR